RRVDPKVSVYDRLPPADARYAYRWVLPKAGGPTIDRYLFLDEDLKELGSVEQATEYDPRARLWYRSAEKAGGTMISDPDIFAALGLIGFTVASPFYVDGKPQGVVAIDITLDGLGAYLSERNISPGTLSYILDAQGRVLAASDLSRTYSNEGGKLEIRHISSLDNELPAIAYAARPRGSEGTFSFSHDGRAY